MKLKTKKSKKIQWKTLMKEIEEAKKDPKFMKGLSEFIRFHTGKKLINIKSSLHQDIRWGLKMKNKNHLTEEEVKEYLWREFEKFMKGQTVGIDKNGQYLYYKWDVDNFLTNPEKRFFD